MGALGRLADVKNCTCGHLVAEHMSYGCAGGTRSCKCKAELVYVEEPAKFGPHAKPEEILVGCKCEHPRGAHDAQGCQASLYWGCDCPGRVITPAYLRKPRVDLSRPRFELSNCTCGHTVREHDETGCTYIEGMLGRCMCRGKYLPVQSRQAGFVPHSQSDVRLEHPIRGVAVSEVFGTSTIELVDCICKHLVFEHGDSGCTHMTRNGAREELCHCCGTLVDRAGSPATCDCDCQTPDEVFSCGCDCHADEKWDQFCTCDHTFQQHGTSGCTLCNCQGKPAVAIARARPVLLFSRRSSKCTLEDCCDSPLSVLNSHKCMCGCHRTANVGPEIDFDHDAVALKELSKANRKARKTSNRVM